ncbi:MAG: LamG-like jellyroll fold domain-containing protein [Armatimonadota bacterium]
MKYLLLLMLVLSAGAVMAGEPYGLTSSYNFDGIADGVAKDALGKLPGRVVGKLKTTRGHDGKSTALLLDGAGYLESPVPDGFAFAAGLTIEVWIQPSQLTSGRLVDRSTAGLADSFCLDTHPGNAIRFITAMGTISTPPVLNTGQWLHVVAVYDANIGKLALYLDGKLAVKQLVLKQQSIGGKNPLRIGADSTGNVGFRGGIDGVRLYHIALNARQVTERFTGKEITLDTGLQAEREPIAYRKGLQADPQALLARNDVVHLSPAIYPHEALPVGNGRLCAMVWNQTGVDLQLNHADNLWAQNSSGRVHLTATPSLTAKSTAFEQRQSLYDGMVKTRCTGEAGQWSSTVTVIPNSDVVAVRLEGTFTPGTQFTITLEQWRKSVQPVADAATAGFTEDLPAGNFPKFNRKMALLARTDCPATIGTPVQSDNGITLTLQPAPVTRADGTTAFTLYLANPIVKPDADPLLEARKQLDQVLLRDWEASRAAAAERWKAFWSRSFVYLHSPDGVGDFQENLWYLHLYWMGCMGEGEYAAKFNGGAFLEHQDSRSWGSSYWYQNTRELYWPLTTANHLELCAPMRHLYISTMDASRKLAKDFFHKRGIQVEETLAITGTGDKALTTSTMLYFSTGLDCALQLYDQCIYARDEQALKNEVYPMMKETVEFYLDYATLGADGLYHITPTTARETYQFVQDGMTDICALRVAIPILLRESARWKVDAEMQPKWETFLAKLAPIPVTPAQDAYAPCIIPATRPVTDNPNIQKSYANRDITTNFKQYFNSENVEMDVVHPFGIVGIDSPRKEFDMAVKAYERRPFRSGGGWDSSPIWAARLGLADAFVDAQNAHCRGTQVSPQGFWYSPSISVFANDVPDCPYFDASGVNATATGEALLQSYDGRIRVWPAVPKSWTGAFRLRAKTGFMVTSEHAAGETRYVEVESLFGDVCRLVNPWPGEMTITSNGGKTILKSAAAVLEFRTKLGQRYLVERAAKPVAGMKFARLAPAANTQPKLLNMTGDPDETPVPGLRQPMLGTTADGVNTPRAAAAQYRKLAQERLAPILANKVRKTGMTASLTTPSSELAKPAPWLTDGIAGELNIPHREHVGVYQLEFPQPTSMTLVVQSYDRTGGRQDARGNMWDAWPAKLVAEVSLDGNAWTRAGEFVFQNNYQHVRDVLTGAAIVFDHPVEAKYLRIRAVDGQDKPVNQLACDELEVY